MLVRRIVKAERVKEKIVKVKIVTNVLYIRLVISGKFGGLRPF